MIGIMSLPLCLVVAMTLVLFMQGASAAIHYAMVIDAGSTGSRAFIFKFIEDPATGNRKVESIKGKKAVPGLSSFAQKPEGVTDYFEPLFLDAVARIPKEFHNETLVYIKGTAGMRLLKQEEQDGIWNALVTGLAEHHNVPFIIHKDNFGTIDGHMEAYYAVLSSNYIAGSIDGNLKRTSKAMVGALDMGGSSTQLIFHTDTPPNQPVQEGDFWSHSWLSFGVDKVREKVWDYLVAKAGPVSSIAAVAAGEDGDNASSSGPMVIHNPCSHSSHEVHLPSGHMLLGTGDRKACQEVILNTIWPGPETCQVNQESAANDASEANEGKSEGKAAAAKTAEAKPCYVDSIQHPPVKGLKFYGMSVYFYAFDCIRHFGGDNLPHWPTPTISELEHAVDTFCATPWSTANTTWTRPSPQAHPWTLDTQLPSRCLETTYLLTLLRHGFGFDPETRDITLALEVKREKESFEVEWTLGFALSEVCLQCIQHYTHTVDADAVMKTGKGTSLEQLAAVIEPVKRLCVAVKAALGKVVDLVRSKVAGLMRLCATNFARS